MMPFELIFEELGARERVVIDGVDHRGKPSRYVLGERYCPEPSCDCQCVLLDVRKVGGKRVLASIAYRFGDRHVVLDDRGPEDALAHELAAQIGALLASDRALVAHLRGHCGLLKQAVGAPTTPPKKPRTPRTPRPPRPAPLSTTVALVAAKVARSEGKLQQKFRRLLEKVDRLKQRIRLWKQSDGEIQRSLAIYATTQERYLGRLRELVELLDRSASYPRFTSAERSRLRDMICELAARLIAEGGHDDLKPIYNRHSRRDYDADEAADAAGMRAKLEQLGFDLGDADVSTPEKIREFLASDEAAAQAQLPPQPARPPRKKSARQVAAEQRRAEDQQRAHKAVQEIYRALARALHPDHEPDPDERARKTRLMSEVNVAYEARDLMRLLELQLELERVESSHIDAIAEERLHYYNRILDDQARQIAAELEARERPYRLQLQISPRVRLEPLHVVARILSDELAIDRDTAQVERDLEAFADPRRLEAWLQLLRPAGARPARGGDDVAFW